MKRGFSLVELVLALLIFQVGILATAGLILTSQRDLVRAELTLIGTLEADLVADSIERFSEPSSGSRRYLWGEVSWSPMVDEIGGLSVVAFSTLLGDTLISLRALPPGDDSLSVRGIPASPRSGG